MLFARLTLFIFLSVAVMGLTACDQDEVQTYEVPKDPTQSALPVASEPSIDAGAWTLPEGWRQSTEAKPMRLATFEAGDPDDPLEVALTVFPEDVGGALANLNRWRGQLGQPPVDEAAMPQHMKPLTEGDEDGGLFVDLIGEAEHADMGRTRVRMVVAMVPSAGQTWFLKAVGLPEQIETHLQAFLSLARQLPPPSSQAGAASSSPPAAAGTHAHAQSHWDAPPHWRADPNMSSMLKAAYTAASEGGTARITLMTLPGDGGGALPNVNRWREQVGLPALNSLDQQPVSRLKVGGHSAVVIDLQGTPPGATSPLRTLVTLVALPRETWFIKMSGDPTAVQKEQANFRKLLESMHFH